MSDSKQDDIRGQIQTIMRLRDYYQVLGIAKGADDNTIKNAYRKLAVRFHPDKNKVAGAKEAFNKISTAYTTLIDKDKRANYERFGSESDMQERAAQQQSQYARRQAQQFDEFNELFMSFFNVPPNPNRFYNQHRTHYTQQSAPPQGRPQVEPRSFRMLQIIVVFTLAYMLVPKLFQAKPYFSMQQTGQFTQRRHTAVFRTLFFARPGYSEYINKGESYRQEIDRKVEEIYIRRLHKECEGNKDAKRRYLHLAQSSTYNRQAYARAASTVDLSTCNKLNDLQSKHPSHFKSLLS